MITREGKAIDLIVLFYTFLRDEKPNEWENSMTNEKENIGFIRGGCWAARVTTRAIYSILQTYLRGSSVSKNYRASNVAFLLINYIARHWIF